LTPRRTVLVGVVPESLGLGIARTPAVEASLPAMVDTVMSLVGDTGEERHAYVVWMWLVLSACERAPRSRRPRRWRASAAASSSAGTARCVTA
jgi:hypothetical protein